VATIKGRLSVFKAEQERVVCGVSVDRGGIGNELVVLAIIDPQGGSEKYVARWI